MKTTQLRLLTVAFDATIAPWELRAFRGAVAKKAGYEHSHFHNHDNETGNFIYRLPLIQYKQSHGRPMLVCLNEGIEELHHFFSQPDWTLSLNGREAPMRIARLDVKQFNLAVLDTPCCYHIRQWLGLNEENYLTFCRLTDLAEKTALLERVLQNQVVALFHQLDVRPDRPIEARILELKNQRWVDYKGVKVLAFSLEMEANVFLPDFLGLGKGASAGWGILRQVKKNILAEKNFLTH